MFAANDRTIHFRTFDVDYNPVVHFVGHVMRQTSGTESVVTAERLGLWKKMIVETELTPECLDRQIYRGDNELVIWLKNDLPQSVMKLVNSWLLYGVSTKFLSISLATIAETISSISLVNLAHFTIITIILKQ